MVPWNWPGPVILKKWTNIYRYFGTEKDKTAYVIGKSMEPSLSCSTNRCAMEVLLIRLSCMNVTSALHVDLVVRNTKRPDNFQTDDLINRITIFIVFNEGIFGEKCKYGIHIYIHSIEDPMVKVYWDHHHQIFLGWHMTLWWILDVFFSVLYQQSPGPQFRGQSMASIIIVGAARWVNVGHHAATG